MKVLHTADWHLGKYLGQHSRLAEQREVLDEICQLAEEHQVDLVLVAGDLYDSFNPPIEAIELLYSTLKRLTRNGACLVVAIAGNHDSPDRIQASDPLARQCGIVLLGHPYAKPLGVSYANLLNTQEGFLEIQLPQVAYPVRLLLTPYANEQRLKKHFHIENKEQELRSLLTEYWQHLADKFCDQKGVNLMAAHLMMIHSENDIQEENLDEERSILHVGGIPAILSTSIPAQMQYVALGHLHKFQTLTHTSCVINYSGSPLSYSFAEANQEKYVVLFEVSPGKMAECQKIALKSGKKLLRQRFEDLQEALGWLQIHQRELVEVTMVSDTFISSKDKRALFRAHDGIINILPEIRSKENIGIEAVAHHASIDLSKNIELLFEDFFKAKNGQQNPSEAIKKLFAELLSQDS